MKKKKKNHDANKGDRTMQDERTRLYLPVGIILPSVEKKNERSRMMKRERYHYISTLCKNLIKAWNRARISHPVFQNVYKTKKEIV